MNDRKKKNLLAVSAGAALLCAGLAASSGLYAAQEAISPTQRTNFTVGDFDVELAPDESREILKTVGPMAAGDTVNLYFRMVNRSQVPIGSITSTHNPAGTLFSGRTPADLKFEACSLKFDESGRCSGVSIPVADVNGEGSKKVNVDLPPNGSIYLKASSTLPHSADNEYAGSNGSIGYTFVAQQKTEDSIPQPESR